MARAIPVACLVLSGAAGLIYEVCWIRRASLVFGSTTYSLSTVLAVFFLGLAIGSWLFGRLSRRVARPLRTFALLELSLAALALASLPLFTVIDGLYGQVFRAAGDAPALLAAARVGLVALILLPPTILMGGTLPLFCRQTIDDEGKIARAVAFLYAMNTAGAALGCAAAGFVLIPELGVTWSVRIAAGLNLVAGLVVLALRPRAVESTPARPDTDPSGASAAPESSGRGPAVVTALFFCTGFVVLGLEVLWTRYLALLVRSSVYTYTLTLTAVLAGIVIGSLLGGLFLDRPVPRARIFGASQVVLGVGVLITMMVPAAIWRSAGEHLGIYFLVLLPPAVLSGLSFPLAVRMVTSDPSLAGFGAGRMAATNTLGGIAGSLVVGFGALPSLGLELSLLLLTGLSVLVGCVAWWLLDDASTVRRAVAAATAILAWAVVPPAFGTRLPGDFLGEPEQLLDYTEGLEANLALIQKDEDIHLEIDRWWQGQSRKSHQVMAAHIPMLLHPDPRRILVVGVGVGQTSVRFLMYDVEQLDCIDIEPRIFDFIREHFDSAWMDDPRVSLIEADGRNYLAHSRATYDVISLELGQLFRPGVAAFYTEEFYRDVRERLAPGGVLSQFVPIPFLEPDTFRELVATFLAVFPESVLWYNTAELLLLGTTAERFPLDRDRLALVEREGPLRADLQYSYWGGPAQWLSRPEVFLGGFLLGPRELAELARGAPRLTDDRPVLEHATWSVHASEADELPVLELVKRHLAPLDGSSALALPVAERPAVELARTKNLRDLEAAYHLRRFQVSKATRSGPELLAMLEAALAANPESVEASRLMAGTLLIAGRHAEAQSFYERALALRPGDAVSHRGMAILLHNSERIPESLPHYRALLAARPEDAEGHNNFAVALGQTGNLAEAIVHFEQALRLRPGVEHVRANLEQTRRALEERR